jgi:hypothetical protein
MNKEKINHNQEIAYKTRHGVTYTLTLRETNVGLIRIDKYKGQIETAELIKSRTGEIYTIVHKNGNRSREEIGKIKFDKGIIRIINGNITWKGFKNIPVRTSA